MQNQTAFVGKPNHVEIAEDGQGLEVSWPGRDLCRVRASMLWAQCPSAAGRKRRIEGIYAPTNPDLSITSFKPIGHYALNIAFSDGHDRGIYTWALLFQLAGRPTLSDFILPAANSNSGNKPPSEKGQQA